MYLVDLAFRCGLVLYLFLSGLVFMLLESHNGWTVIDGWYFSIVTLGTVG